MLIVQPGSAIGHSQCSFAHCTGEPYFPCRAASRLRLFYFGRLPVRRRLHPLADSLAAALAA